MNALRKYDILENDYDINIIRKKSEEIRNDPFDLGKTVKGLTYLNHTRNLSDYAQELVSSYGEFIGNQYELDLEKLSSPLQLELVRLYIESIDREIEWACYGEDQSINSDFLCAMLAMLKDSNPKTRANFAQVTTHNLIAYYKEPLQEVIDTACHDLHCHEMNEAGFHQEKDMEHGDYVWAR